MSSIEWNTKNIGIGAVMAAPTLCSLYFRKDGLLGNPVVLSALLSGASYNISDLKTRRTIEWSNYFLIACSILRMLNGSKFCLHPVLDSFMVAIPAGMSNNNILQNIWAGPLVAFGKTTSKPKGK